jgi:hypothetical protein
MAVNKDRKIFSLQSFRGLDKENKPLKVAPFRASDGYNFILDSDVLKTRPAFKINEALPFVLVTGEFLIDWYDFRGTKLYVTSKRIFFGDDEIFEISDNKNFSLKQPMFFEEKEALFIFGLDTIYVASIIDTDNIFYLLNNKTANPYDVGTELSLFNAYEDLPTPYVPTLFIGNNSFEDINLLSNKTKYKIFAENTNFGFFVRDGNTTTYKLPTAYSFEKNGNYQESVSFYKNIYQDIEFFPIFIDVMYPQYQDSFADLGDYINEVDESDNVIPIDIEETYYVKKDIEKVYDTTSEQYLVSDNRIDITKKEVFNFTVKNLGVSVFEYCMERSRSINETENVTLVFRLNIDYNEVLRSENGVLVSSERRTDSVNFLILFQKYDTQTFDVINLEHAFNEITIPFNSVGQFPQYPPLTGHNYITPALTVNGGTLYLNDTIEVIQAALNAARRAVVEIRNTLTSLDKIRVNLQYVVIDPEDFPPVRKKLYSISVGVQYTEDVIFTKDSLYKISYNSKENTFELTLRDFFIDFRNEPSIEVEITFENNPDFELISDSTFGTLFGSENRLFLAGHPDFPNIDRYNVSNDLLGIGNSSQSYELSYFPSKNYRVVGGKGAINGYVVATDTSLYISKEEYPGDNKLFVRTRNLDNNGVAGYFEYKTNVSKTPLNPRCFVRFYNDIVMLSKDGLYAIELTDNILTSERLLKLRSGFINTDLKQAIENFNNEKIFIAENNYYMYIFINDVVYVADSRYIDTNQNASIGNVSYEIVKWYMNTSYRLAKLTETKAFLLDDTYSQIYTLVLNQSQDDNVERTTNVVSTIQQSNRTYFITPSSYDTKIQSKPENVQFIFPSGLQYLASHSIHYTRIGTTLTVIDSDIFRDITDGDTLYYSTTQSFVVSGFEASNRTTMACPNVTINQLYRSIANVPLYIVEIEGGEYYRLDRYKPDSVAITTTVSNVLTYDFFEIPNTCNINYAYPIEMMWLSNIMDFGNNFLEKTMFRVNLYATKQSDGNILNFGYKTMRRLRELEDSNAIIVPIMIPDKIDLSNNFNFNEMSFNIFSLNTFQESGLSLPMKENNFLYIQFMIHASGNVEFNGFHVVYKNNRSLKSIG